MRKQEITYDVSEEGSVRPARKDGTSQQARLLKALDHRYFQPEERGMAEWIQYARAFSKVLAFPDLSGKSATWKSFLDRGINEGDSQDPDTSEIIAFFDDPSSFAHDPEKSEWLSRPHFVLLMTFFKLLEYSRERINGFTRRHLDFYYRDILQFSHAGAQMDTVHAMVKLEKNVRNFVLKKGTLLNAGKGPAGEDIQFATTENFYLNNARVAATKSVFLDREEFDLVTLRQKYKDVVDEDFGMWPVFRLVYAVPSYEDDLPLFPGDSRKNRELLDSFEGIDQKVKSNQEKIGLGTADFKMLMSSKANAEKESAPWSTVDYWLSQAGKKKKGNPDFQITGTNETNFNAQFKKAVGDITLEEQQTIDEYYQWILAVEKYFFLPVDDAGFIIAMRQMVKDSSGKQPSQSQWADFFELLEKAYDGRFTEARKQELKGVMQGSGSVADRFTSMLQYALGDPDSGDPLPDYSSSIDAIYADLQQRRDARHEAYLRDELFLEPDDFMFLMSLRSVPEDAEGWETGYTILERAMRRKRKIVAEKPVLEEWYNLYKSEEASSIKSTDSSIGWKPFGMEGKGEKVAMGIVVSSPVLALAEGVRKIVITLFFDGEGFEEEDIARSLQNNPFLFKVSSSDGFHELAPDQASLALTSAQNEDEKRIYQITATLSLDPSHPPVEPVAAEDVLPATQLILREQQDGHDTKIPYKVYRKLKLQKVDVDVEVTGLKKIFAENDNGSLNLKKPFEPFGSSPVVGSRFYFINEEIANKKLDRLTFNFQWMGKPDLKKIYDTYEVTKDKDFTASLFLAEKNSEFLVTDKILIMSDTAGVDVGKKVKAVNARYDHENVFTDEDEDDILQARRYFFLELNEPDFQHTAYPILLQETFQKKALDETDTTPLPKQPYTPKLKSLTLDYASHVSIYFNDDANGFVSYLHPFGTEKITEGPVANFLPSYEDEGILYIGIEDLVVPDTVSLFFQIDPNSANPTVFKPTVELSYLTRNGWKQLSPSSVIQDTTRNLGQSGIIQLTIPEDATSNSTILGVGKIWLKLSVYSDSSGINDFVDIGLQGIEAVMASHQFHWRIPAGTIKSTVQNLAQIKSLHQPYASFGGAPAESDEALYMRISERLRHKRRAVDVWDYERLVLHNFRGVYKVKTLPADHVHNYPRVVVIPRLTGSSGMNLFEPRLSQPYLLAIQDFLKSNASPFAAIKVINPRYQQVKVRVSVRLKSGYNETLCSEQINKSIQRFLSPWAFDTDGEVTFGGVIYANAIVNLLEKQDCIQYVVGVKLFISDGEGNFIFVAPDPLTNTNMTIAPDTDTILVSAASHEIDIINDDRIDYDDLSGIGYMKVELDFKVN